MTNRFLEWVQKRPILANVAAAPFAGLYALGGGINTLTGGKTDTYNIFKAINRGTSGQEYSPTIQAFSGYTGPELGHNVKPNQGDHQLPILNPATSEVVVNIADTALAPLGLDLRKAIIGAGLIGAVVLAAK